MTIRLRDGSPSIEGSHGEAENSADKPFALCLDGAQSNLPSDLPSITVICLG